ncbi:MAG: cupin domain-containing protein [Bacteroidales bacterium]|nr:cupin domain-containing protein [Bacteroidales bacterium]
MKKNLLMNVLSPAYFLLVLSGLNVLIQNPVFSQTQNQTERHPEARIIAFDPGLPDYQELFDGPKDSVVFYSGVVTIIPGQYGELHSTEIYEEMIIPLEGHGQLIIPPGRALDLKFGIVGFVPPETQHQVYNKGTGDFRYIYVAVRSY